MAERGGYSDGGRARYRRSGNGNGFEGPNMGALSAYVPPQNLDAEQSTLGAMLIERAAIEKAAEILSKEDFYRDAHQTLFEAITNLAERDEPVDFITVQEELKNREKLDLIGGPSYLAALLDKVPTAANIEYYAKIVQEKALLRRLIEAALEIVGLARGEVDDVSEVLDKAEQLVFSVSQQQAQEYFAQLRTLLLSVYDKAEELGEMKQRISGLSTGIHDFDMITSGLQNTDLIIIAARPSMGKCLKFDSLVDHPVTGERLTIEEYVKQRIPTVLGLSDTGMVREAIIGDWVDSGVKPCYRVRTCTGRTVEVTGHHPFLTVHGWTPLHDLSVGSKIAVPRAVPSFGTDESVPQDLVRLLAYFIAEGGLTGTSPAWTNTDPILIADFQSIITRHFPECSFRKERITYIVRRPRGQKWNGHANPVNQWLGLFGLRGKLAEAKSFPDCVWRWPKAHLAEFLRVLMSCDGTIYAMQGYPRIEFAVASEQLAQDVHHALTRFGIVSKLWRKTPRCWRVEITDPQSVTQYQEQIGWVGEKSDRFAGEYRTGRRSNSGHLPQAVWPLVCDAAARLGLSMVELARRSGETTRAGKNAGYNPHIHRGLPQKRLAAYAQVLNDPELLRLANPDIYWDEIVAIEPVGEHKVYDLCVPEGANFIAQDICVHNTSLCLSIAEHVALKEKKPVAIFSLEMSKEQLAMRMLCSQAQVNAHKLRTGHLAEDEWGDLAKVVQDMYDAPIFIDDATETSALTMRAKCRRLMAEHGLGLIVVDYLQLMRSHRRTENRVQEIGEIARGLKSLGRELKVPVIALSQLSRAVESRENKRPMLSDLRESGSIEAEADMVCFLYREAYYKMKEAYSVDGADRPEREPVEETEIIVGKHRNGPTGMVKVGFMPEFAKFVDLELRRDDEPTGF
jgi:replicative DNA helicase